FQDPVDPNVIHLATKGGYFYSVDSGATWFFNNAGLASRDQQDVKVVAIRANPYQIWIGTKTGLFFNEGRDGLWQQCAPEQTGQSEIKTMVFNADGRSLYLYIKGKGEASLAEGLYRTDDRGETWVALNPPTLEEIKEYGMAPSPTNPDEILISDKKGAVYHSLDRGSTWQWVGIPGLTEEIKVLLRDAANPDLTWYAGSKEGFYKTKNGGLPWTVHNEGLVPQAAEGKDIVVHPSNPLQVYVGTKTGLWMTHGGAESVGEGWVELTQQISTLFSLDVRKVLVDYANDPSGNTIYIAAKFDLFKMIRKDGSLLWVDSSRGIASSPRSEDKDIKWIAQDPADPQILYAARKLGDDFASVGELYRSTDEGAQWQKISADAQFTGEQEGDIKNVTILGDFLFLGTKNGVYKANKHGALPLRFTLCNEGIALDKDNEIKVEKFAFAPDHTLFIATKTGIYLSKDEGLHWTDITGNLSNEQNAQVEVDSIYYDARGRLWAGVKKLGLFFTSNPQSANWREFNKGLPEGNPREIKAILAAPSDPTRFYIGTKSGTFANHIAEETRVLEWSTMP
ncbi:MAG: hypothetical protein RBU29_11525, partial [bacterium]|nr:hypothetical protein [bacterium]